MMVSIKLDNRFAISSDKFQWVLLLDSRPYQFFTDLETLLKSYLNLKSRSSDARLIYSLMNYQKQLLERLHTLLTSPDFKTKLPVLASGEKND